MKLVLSFLLLLSFSCFTVALTSYFSRINAQMTYSQGVFTNLCGTGTAATAHSCNQGCNVKTGSCSAKQATVVKFTCDGKVTDCRNNESSFSTSQSLEGVSCGKTVQLDIFNKVCRTDKGWVCGDRDLQDYLVWYSGDCPAKTSTATTPQVADKNTCDTQQPVAIQFRKSGGSWQSGPSVTAAGITVGEELEVNCFAQNGTKLLPGGTIQVTAPQGKPVTVSSSSELKNYRSFAAGTHSFSCISNSIASCGANDKITIQAAKVENKAVTVNPVKPISGKAIALSSSAPVAKAVPAHESACTGLAIVNGNNSLVPATVKLRASGTDNRGSLQKYRFTFGDGSVVEADKPELDHRYEVSGTFSVRAEIKDSQGNWKGSDACATTVTVKPAAVESHKSACSDLEVTIDNNGQAPATAKFKVSGYDNKGSIQKYKISLGNGTTRESDTQTFEEKYLEAGTFVAQAAIRDSQGNWKEDSTCRKTVYVSTQPLTQQPATGTPTIFTLAGLISGSAGIGIQYWKRRLKL